MNRERSLVALASFWDVASADALVAFLSARGIDAHVEGADPLSIGLGSRVRVVVAEEDLRPARWAIDSAEVSDGEAWFLAKGELDPAAARDAFARDRDAAATRTRRAAGVAATLGLIAVLAAALISR